MGGEVHPAILVGGFAGVLAATLVAVGVVRHLLLRLAILDQPNPRSSHTTPTPRGGGIGVLAVLLPAWAAILAAVSAGGTWWLVPLGALALACVSWLDDVRGLPPLTRLAVQLVAAGVAALSLPGPIFQGLLPPLADAMVAVLLWVWFVNLFNFMDGIDGLAGVEAASVGMGLFVVTILAGTAASLGWLGLAVAASALGFLYWNWQPARIFLGDSGSVPLGFLIGWLCLALAAHGQWAASVILPLYYLGDATLTLLRRLVRGERVWQAHRTHFYQFAVQRGLGHAQVCTRVLGANLALVLLAAAAVLWSPWLALAAAALVVAATLAWLARRHAA